MIRFRVRISQPVALALALLAALALSVTLWAQDSLPEVARLRVQVHQLKVENARLRSALATLQAELDSERLTDERATLEQQLRDEVRPPAGHVFDWTKGLFVPPPQEPPK